MMKLANPSKFKIEIYNRPGSYMSNVELKSLHEEILSVAASCLDEIPQYQCLTGKRNEYSRLLIAVARNPEGKMLGFCSSYILKCPEGGNVLHLGLTCVMPIARRMGFTHKLTSKVVMTYIFKYSLFKPAWISNVACVVSSLGNVALHFEDVYPSPFVAVPTDEHLNLARMINTHYRHELYIGKDATFKEEGFVFERSVCGTMFEKSANDKRFFHRDSDLTDFYLKRMDFSNGDEILQIGKVSLLTYPKYVLRTFKRKMRKTKTLTTAESF